MNASKVENRVVTSVLMENKQSEMDKSFTPGTREYLFVIFVPTSGEYVDGNICTLGASLMSDALTSY